MSGRFENKAAVRAVSSDIQSGKVERRNVP